MDTTLGHRADCHRDLHTPSAKKYYRLEAESADWPFPGTTITYAREASVSGTNGGYLTMSTSSCTATA